MEKINCPGCNTESNPGDLRITVLQLGDFDYYVLECSSCQHRESFSSIPIVNIWKTDGLLEYIISHVWSKKRKVENGQ